MEFFLWLEVPQYVLQFVQGGISLTQMYICLAVAGGLYLVCLALGGLGLYVMGSRAGIKHAWLGFIPFANTYYAGKVAGEANFFGQKMKRAGLYAMILEMVYVGLEILSLVISVVLSNEAYYEIKVINGNSYQELVAANVPAQLRWMITGLTWAPVLAMICYIVLAAFLCVVYTALFRKYYARSPFIMTFLSVLLPVRGIIFFCVRKNAPVDYSDYMRRRMESAMRQAGMPAQGGYGGNSSSGDAPRGGSPFSDYDDDSPFSEFGGRSDSPNGDPQGNDKDGEGN